MSLIESDGNVIFNISLNAGFLYGGNEVDGLPMVSDVQFYLDLKRMSGRNPSRQLSLYPLGWKTTKMPVVNACAKEC